MKSHLLWLCSISAMLMLACNSPAQKTEAKHDTVIKKSTTVTKTTDTVAVTDTSDSECPRDKSSPVIKKSVFPDAQFALQADGRTGIETLTLTDGDKVTITQMGCEYFILKFKFETTHFAADTTDVRYWSNAALTFMRKVNKGLDVPLDVAEALNKLSARIEQDKKASQNKLELGEEIDFGGPDPRQYLIIERVSKLDNQRFAVEVSLSYGPM